MLSGLGMESALLVCNSQIVSYRWSTLLDVGVFRPFGHRFAIKCRSQLVGIFVELKVTRIYINGTEAFAGSSEMTHKTMVALIFDRENEIFTHNQTACITWLPRAV